jgi:hypothetical protein
MQISEALKEQGIEAHGLGVPETAHVTIYTGNRPREFTAALIQASESQPIDLLPAERYTITQITFDTTLGRIVEAVRMGTYHDQTEAVEFVGKMVKSFVEMDEDEEGFEYIHSGQARADLDAGPDPDREWEDHDDDENRQVVRRASRIHGQFHRGEITHEEYTDGLRDLAAQAWEIV